MSAASAQLPRAGDAAPPMGRVLRRLFLTLFLRGRSSRGLRKDAPKSIGRKLGTVMMSYAAAGLLSIGLLGQSVFALAIYLHALTFVFLGMFIAASAGEVLFNKEEAEILLHRPIEPRLLLWAKVWVLVEISLWLGGAFNLAGMVVGLGASDGGWRFPIAHALSTTVEALFCTGIVVLVYQLCLRWFGRERLDGLMTTAQVLVGICAVLAGQILPRMVMLPGKLIRFGPGSWWMGLMPPAWFAGMDDAIGGSGLAGSWLLAFCGVAATGAVLALAFGKLARAYETGMQTLGETSSMRKKDRGRPWLERFVNLPPLGWWLRDPVSCASFLLTVKYLVRDRDVKLRIYPGIAPMLVVPFIFLFQKNGAKEMGEFGIAFVGAYLGLVPLMGVTLMQYAQQWQASDVFRTAPLAGPGLICDGSRRAVLLFLALPVGILFVTAACLINGDFYRLILLIPGLIALPIYALWPNMGGKAVPLSVPPEEAKSAGRTVSMIVVMLVSMGISGAGLGAWYLGVFWWLVGVEAVGVMAVYGMMRRSLGRARWESAE